MNFRKSEFVMSSKVLLVITFLLTSISSTHAAVIQYDESIDGDISHLSQYIGQTDIGINSISGHAGVASFSDLDVARIGVQADQQITGINFSLDNIIDNGNHTVFSIHISPAFSSAIDIVYFHLNSISSFYLNDGYDDYIYTNGGSFNGNIFTNILPVVGNGNYELKVNSFSGAPLNVEFDYSWLLEVNSTVVPIPPAIWLFASALIGLLSITRRSKITAA
jgi:hypothetical protein